MWSAWSTVLSQLSLPDSSKSVSQGRTSRRIFISTSIPQIQEADTPYKLRGLDEDKRRHERRLLSDRALLHPWRWCLGRRNSPPRCKLSSRGQARRAAEGHAAVLPGKGHVLMSRNTLRTTVAAALLAAFLLPAAAPAWGATRATRPAERGFISVFWDFLNTLFKGTATDNRWGIDPNGATTNDTGDNRWGIDPNG